MTMFKCVWEIDLEADSPREAAEKAREIQARPGTTATVYDVYQAGPPDRPKVTVDLCDAVPRTSWGDLRRYHVVTYGIRNGVAEAWRIADENANTIATVRSTRDAADMLAASPDMLAAIRAILLQVCQGPVLERDSCISQARHAFGKAGGFLRE